MCCAVMMFLLPVVVTKMSASGKDVLERRYLVSLHSGLQRADRVDFGHHDTRPLAAERLGAPLADVAVAAHDGHLAADEHVSGPVDSVDQASGGSRTCCRTSTWSPSRSR